MSLILQDSNFQDGITKRYHEQCAAYMNTVDQLQQKIVDGQLEIVNLQTYNPRSDIESPVWYEIKSYGEKRGYKVVNECHFYSSHYIGRYSHDGYAIIINPRFGNILIISLAMPQTFIYPMDNQRFRLTPKTILIG